MTPGKVIHNRGTVSVQLTTYDIISLAVNVVQNGRSPDELGCGSAEDPLAFRQMLAEVYDHILATNSQAASRLPYKRRRQAASFLGCDIWLDLGASRPESTVRLTGGCVSPLDPLPRQSPACAKQFTHRS